MASSRLIRGRIKSAKNIAQITKAMEMVSASKMRKAQAAALAGKVYAQKIYEAVYELAKNTDPKNHPLLNKNLHTDRSLVILVTTNKGLCGSLNTNLFRAALKWFAPRQKYDFIVLGKKGESFVVRTQYQLKAAFGLKESFLNTVSPVISLAISEYLNGSYKEIIIAYNNFVNALKQEPTKKTILPLGVSELIDIDEKNDFSEFLIEPSSEELFEALLPHYIENQLREAILEGEASEHSARMIAMKNATDNALDLLKDLTLEYNKARQEKITSEISDMVTARMAFN